MIGENEKNRFEEEKRFKENIENENNKGKYYLIHDINYRYVQNDMHGHNVTFYSKYSIIINECKENVEEVLKNSLLDYSLNYLSFQDYEGGKLYQSNKKNNKKVPNNFNLSFIVFDNRDGINDVTLQYNIIFKKQKCSDFYLEEGKKNETSLTKTIEVGDWDIFIQMPFSYNSVFSYSFDNLFISSSKSSEKYNKKEEKEKKRRNKTKKRRKRKKK